MEVMCYRTLLPTLHLGLLRKAGCCQGHRVLVYKRYARLVGLEGNLGMASSLDALGCFLHTSIFLSGLSFT